MKTRSIIISVLLCIFALTAVHAQGQLDARRHDFPPAGKYQVLIGDFHMHTLNSDGRPTTRERVEESFRMGYDVISVTDHGKTRAYRVAKHVGEKLGLVVINGLETGVKGKEHMNAFGMTTDFVPRNPHSWAEEPGQNTAYYRDAMKNVVDHGGVVIYNHPHVGYREPVLWGIEQGYVIGIEVKNDVVRDKWNTTEWNGLYCYPDAFDFALKHNLTLFANTDVHGNRDPEPARTLVLVEERSPKGVMDAIHARRTAAWFGPNGGVVWGRQDLLSDLLTSTVAVSKTSNGNLAFHNRGPIPLKAKVEGCASSVQLPAYEEAVVAVSASGASVSVTWENVWTDPNTNLTTRHTAYTP